MDYKTWIFSSCGSNGFCLSPLETLTDVCYGSTIGTSSVTLPAENCKH